MAINMRVIGSMIKQMVRVLIPTPTKLSILVNG